MALSDTLKQKAGPLPVWAWGVILGTIIVAGMYWYSSRSSAGGATVENTGDGVAYPDLDGSSSSGGGTGTVVTDAGTGIGSVATAPEFSSNLAWKAFAIARLSGEGFSPLAVQQALEHYISGDTLTVAEQTIVNAVLSRYGLPPNGVDMTPTLEPVTAVIPGVVKPVVKAPDKVVIPNVGTPVTGLIGTAGTAATVQQALSAVSQGAQDAYLNSDYGNLKSLLASSPTAAVSTTATAAGQVVQVGNVLTVNGQKLDTTGKTTADLQALYNKQVSTVIGKTNSSVIAMIETAIRNQGGTLVK